MTYQEYFTAHNLAKRLGQWLIIDDDGCFAVSSEPWPPAGIRAQFNLKHRELDDSQAGFNAIMVLFGHG